MTTETPTAPATCIWSLDQVLWLRSDSGSNAYVAWLVICAHVDKHQPRRDLN